MLHSLDEGLEEPVGTNRRRPRLHYLFNETIVLAFQGGGAETTDHDSVAVDHRTYLPLLGCMLSPDRSHRFAQAACGDVTTGGVGDKFLWFKASFDGKAGRLPVGDPGDIVEHLGEPECLEPARGSW